MQPWPVNEEMEAVHEHSKQETFIHPTVEDRNPRLSRVVASQVVMQSPYWAAVTYKDKT